MVFRFHFYSRFHFIVSLILTYWGCLVILSSPAFACPPLLEKMSTVYLPEQKTLCQVYDQYQETKALLQKQGINDYQHIADFIGPRFINFKDWQNNRETSKFNPAVVYQPAPMTWFRWEQSQAYMQPQILANQQNQNFAPFNLDWILKMHAVAMQDLSTMGGQLRGHSELGFALYRKYAVTKKQVVELRSSGGLKSSVRDLEPLYQWQPTICGEEQSKFVSIKISLLQNAKKPWFNNNDWPVIAADKFFRDAQGEFKQCGYLIYAPPNELAADLNAWLEFINGQSSRWGTNSEQLDSLLVLARAQRWFIGIHPFADGNGRISRNIIDLFLLSLDLPPPIFTNMDEDIYLSEEAWAHELGAGILRSLKVLQNCAAKPTTAGCQVMPMATLPEKPLAAKAIP